MNKIISIFIILLLWLLCINVTVSAEQINIKSVSPSPYYDSQPRVWDDYIVWRRGINQNENAYIELFEPSWIMVGNYKSGKYFNITVSNQNINSKVRYHAQSPDIWNGKVIYEAQMSGDSIDTQLFMYNISSKDTWQLPIQSTRNANGHLHLIYDSWIVYTTIVQNKRQAYMYNYESGIYRTIIGPNSDKSVYGIVMNDNYVILTVADKTDSFDILVYNIYTSTYESINYNITTQVIATSINGNIIGLNIRETNNNITMWCTYTYNIETSELTKIKNNTYGILFNSNQIVYQTSDSIRVEHDIYGVSMLPQSQTLHLSDIHGNTVVWTDNTNSNVTFDNARDNFDIYIREIITDKEIAIDSLYIIVPIVFFVVLGLLLKRESYRNQG